MLTDEMRADGWTEHDGGPCPVKVACNVVVRSGLVPFVSYLFEGWEHSGSWFDVLAYKPEDQS